MARTRNNRRPQRNRKRNQSQNHRHRQNQLRNPYTLRAIIVLIIAILIMYALSTFFLNVNPNPSPQSNENHQTLHNIKQSIDDLKMHQMDKNDRVKFHELRRAIEDIEDKFNQKIEDMELENLNLYLKLQMKTFNELCDDIENNYENIENDVKSYNVDVNDINSELQHIYQYHNDQLNDNNNNNNNNGYNIVLLGQTGYGKSTFGNRICGDISAYGNITCFTTSPFVGACTNETEKKIIKYLYPKPLTIIDTAGFFDPNHEDDRNVENLIATLRGSGGINAFLIFGSHRFDDGFQQILRNMTNIFGEEFWRHIIFVRTRVYGQHFEAFNEWAYRFREKIEAEFGFIDDAYNLSIFPMDTWHYYKKPIREQFFHLIPKKRFNCKAIESPIQKLIKQLNDTKTDLYEQQLQQNTHRDKFVTNYKEINSTLNKIKTLDEKTYDENYRIITQKHESIQKYMIDDEVKLKDIKQEELSKTTSKFEIEIIDYSKKNFAESLFPMLINDTEKAKLDIVMRDCHIDQNSIDAYATYLHEHNPYSMITVDDMCTSIGKSCTHCQDIDTAITNIDNSGSWDYYTWRFLHLFH